MENVGEGGAKPTNQRRCKNQIPNKLKAYFKKCDLNTRKNAIVEYLDCQRPFIQLKGPKGNGDMQGTKRD